MTRLCAGAPLALAPACAHAQHLAGGDAPDVSMVRVLAAFAICLAAAIALIVLVRNRNSDRAWPSLRPLFPNAAAPRQIAVVEVARFSPMLEIALIRHADVEYLLAYGQPGIEVLSRHRLKQPEA